MNLLFASAHLPVECSRQAGHKTAFRHLKWLSEVHSVDLLCFCSEGDQGEPLGALQSMARTVKVIPVSRRDRLWSMATRPGLPLLVAARWQSAVATTMREWVRRTRYDHLHLEWGQMGCYADALGIGLAGQPPASIYLHDVMNQWAERRAVGMGAALWRWETRRTRRWEAEIYQRFARLFVPSRKDAELVSRMNPGLESRVSVLELHYDRYAPKARRQVAKPMRILFWGALGRRENVDAARWILHRVVPVLSRSGEDFRLILAGSNPPADLLELREPRVEVTGFLPDPRPCFESAHVAMLPLFEGAGVKVKVLECLGAGMPVLTTAVGAEGVEATQADGLYVLPAEPEAFAAAAARLAADPAEYEAAVLGATRWAGRQDADLRKQFFADLKLPGVRDER